MYYTSKWDIYLGKAGQTIHTVTFNSIPKSNSYTEYNFIDGRHSYFSPIGWDLSPLEMYNKHTVILHFTN